MALMTLVMVVFQVWVLLERNAPLNGLQLTSYSEEKSETEPDEGGLCSFLVNDLGQRQDDEDHCCADNAAVEDGHQAEAGAQEGASEDDHCDEGHESQEDLFHRSQPRTSEAMRFTCRTVQKLVNAGRIWCHV